MFFSNFRDSNGGAKMSNGYPEQNNSPNSSQLSGEHSDGAPTLISRTQKQHTTQQVCNYFWQYFIYLTDWVHETWVSSWIWGSTTVEKC